MDCNFRNGKKQAWRNSGFSGIRIRAFQIIFGCFYELSYEVTHWELTRQLHCLTLHRPLTASLYSRTQTFSHASSTRGLLFLTGSLCSRTRFLAGSHNSRTQTFSRKLYSRTQTFSRAKKRSCRNARTPYLMNKIFSFFFTDSYRFAPQITLGKKKDWS